MEYFRLSRMDNRTKDDRHDGGYNNSSGKTRRGDFFGSEGIAEDVKINVIGCWRMPR
ncbi:hypothetical protein OS493_040480, partial [Desmophyllum pertusum]